MLGRATLLSVAMVGVLACEHSDSSGLVVVDGTYVDYRYSPELDPCGGNPAAVNAFALYAAPIFGYTATEIPHTTHAWVTEDDFMALTSCDEALGCASGRDAISRIPLHYHEISHTLNVSGPRFLNEGLAVALSRGWNTANLGDPEPRPYMVEFDPDQAYTPAGLFVAYILQAHGADKFRALYAAIPPDSSMADWEAAFQEIFKSSVDEFVDAYLAATTCPADVAPFPPFECSAPELVPDGGAFTFSRVLDCGDSDVEGGIAVDPPGYAQEAGGGAFWVTRTFVVETAGEFDLTVDTPRNDAGVVGYAAIQSCGGCAWLPEVGIPVRGGETVREWLDAGKYFFTMQVYGTEPREASVSITPVP